MATAQLVTDLMQQLGPWLRRQEQPDARADEDPNPKYPKGWKDIINWRVSCLEAKGTQNVVGGNVFEIHDASP